ncbi:MAG: HAD family hydrolase [Chromatiaceae bacterium]|nr:MAG: HAD family hydrolase [Chromatiaceae bacterium]
MTKRSPIRATVGAGATAATSTGAVLFDLDGTFADTAPDMGAALNRLRAAHGQPPLPLAMLRPHVSSGSLGMLRVGFGIGPDHPDYGHLREAYLACYAADLCRDTLLFPGIAELIAGLATRGRSWGIVTNKPAWLTDPLLAAMDLPAPPACVVSGDTLARAKPHPDPLLHACQLLHLAPSDCWYIGDDQRDILAGRAAGMATLAALYGYLGVDCPPHDWGADGLIAHPLEVLAWVDGVDCSRIDAVAGAAATTRPPPGAAGRADVPN